MDVMVLDGFGCLIGNVVGSAITHCAICACRVLLLRISAHAYRSELYGLNVVIFVEVTPEKGMRLRSVP